HGRTILGIEHGGGRVRSVLTRDPEGRVEEHRAAHFVSSIPIRELVGLLDPAAPDAVREAASALSYRDFISVALMIDRAQVFPDNWIYIHDPTVKVGRIQNFKNWSPDMVPDSSKTCLGLEYFCNAGDEIRSLSDDQLVELAKAELCAIGLVDPARVLDGTVVHAANAYPIYDDGYAAAVQVVRDYLGRFDNIQTIGRNGTHTYNNQDHSMVMGMLAA